MTEILEIQELCTQQARSHLDALGFYKNLTACHVYCNTVSPSGEKPAQTGYIKRILLFKNIVSLFFVNCDLLKNTVKWAEPWFKEVSKPIIWQTFQAEELNERDVMWESTECCSRLLTPLLCPISIENLVGYYIAAKLEHCKRGTNTPTAWQYKVTKGVAAILCPPTQFTLYTTHSCVYHRHPHKQLSENKTKMWFAKVFSILVRKSNI